MLAVGNLKIDQTKGLVYRQDETQGAPLDEKTGQVLIYLAKNQHRIVFPSELENQFWQDQETPDNAQVSQVIETITKLLNEPGGQPAISIMDNGGYLLNLPVFEDTFKAVTTAEIKATIQRNQKSLVVRRPPVKPETPQGNSNKILIGVIALVVVIVIFVTR
jgi:DNA-binding winged helix-turn-helix (wHTH) protein